MKAALAHPFRFTGYLLFTLVIVTVTLVSLAVDHFRGALR
jgi:hypothetical protein